MAMSATSSSTISFFSSSIFLTSPSQNSKFLSTSLKFTSMKTTTKTIFHSQNPASSKTLIRSELATLPILSFDGEKIGETSLDLKSAPPETARAVVHRGIITDQQNKRRGTASTLTRGEVRGGGKKPYPQKKTGRARRGSQRTPLRPGGGVVFGPKPKDWSIKINRKEKRLAISTALSSATVNAIVVEDFSDKFDKPKTKEFIEAMKRWGIDPKEKSMFLLTEVSDNVKLSSRNIGTLKLLTPRTLNLFDILNSDKLVLTQPSVDYLNKMYGIDYEGETEDDEDYEEEEEEDEEEEAVEGGEADDTSNVAE
ncbi:Ribosomal protein L4/L1e [Macleaya cordata]|uniref:Large ribosomal subunit protein uL4c n=1 Tax=Macleaya cordata TaxID=56857 RepID=A0A200R4N6_MACCD|nr:Ribosomal protein L4/L1e [Macleaya cordata]